MSNNGWSIVVFYNFKNNRKTGSLVGYHHRMLCGYYNHGCSGLRSLARRAETWCFGYIRFIGCCPEIQYLYLFFLEILSVSDIENYNTFFFIETMHKVSNLLLRQTDRKNCSTKILYFLHSLPPLKNGNF